MVLIYLIQHQHLFTSHSSRFIVCCQAKHQQSVDWVTNSTVTQTALLHKHILMLNLFYNSVSKSVLALLSFCLITTDPKASRKVRTGHFESAPTCCVLRHLPRIKLMAWEPKRGIVFTNCRVFRWFVTTLEIAASKGRNTASSVHSEVVRSASTVTFKQNETLSKYTKHIYSPELLVSNFIRHIDYCDWFLLFFLSCSR